MFMIIFTAPNIEITFKREEAKAIVKIEPKELSTEDKIKEVFGQDAKMALAIAQCESQMDSQRIGDTNMAKFSYGLFQINQTWHDYPAKTLLDADENIRIAHEIFLKDGWQRWSCYTEKFYLKYF